MKIMNDLYKVLFIMAGLGILQFIIKYWVGTQDYTTYSMITGIIFFLTVAYFLYKECKI